MLVYICVAQVFVDASIVEDAENNSETATVDESNYSVEVISEAKATVRYDDRMDEIIRRVLVSIKKPRTTHRAGKLVVDVLERGPFLYVAVSDQLRRGAKHGIC